MRARTCETYLDGVRVGRPLGGVDELVGEALGDGLDVVERRLAGADGDEGDGLVDTAKGGDVDGLATDGSLGTDTGGVFTRAGVDDGVDKNLEEREPEAGASASCRQANARP